MPCATQTLTLGFDRDWHAGLPRKIKSRGISSQDFSLISFFLNNRLLFVFFGSTYFWDCPINAAGPEGLLLGSLAFPAMY